MKWVKIQQLFSPLYFIVYIPFLVAIVLFWVSLPRLWNDVYGNLKKTCTSNYFLILSSILYISIFKYIIYLIETSNLIDGQ